jgi:hypothetical protein
MDLASLCTREALFAYVVAAHEHLSYCQFPKAAA